MNLRFRIDSAHPSPSLTSPIRLYPAFVRNDLPPHHGEVVVKPNAHNTPMMWVKKYHQPKGRCLPLRRLVCKRKNPRRPSKAVGSAAGSRGNAPCLFLAKRSCQMTRMRPSTRKETFLFCFFCYFLSIATESNQRTPQGGGRA